MKKRFIQFLSLVLAISFFLCNSRPVLADYDYDLYTIEPEQVLAYTYWNNAGFQYTQSFTNSTNIAVPQYYTDNGNTGYSLICNNNNYTGDPEDYACFYRSNSTGQVYGTWYRSTNVAHTETEQNISIQGAEIPWLSGTYTHYSSYGTNNNPIYIAKGATLYISTITTNNLYGSAEVGGNLTPQHWVQGWTDDGSTLDVNLITSSQVRNAYLYTIAIGPNNTDYRRYVVLDFPTINTNTKLIPLYVGLGNDLNDSLKQQIGLTTRSEKALETIAANSQQNTLAVQRQNSLVEYGNTNSQSATSDLTQSNSELSGSVSQINSIETGYNDDLNAALNDIDLSTDLVQHTGFTNAALWVSAQFNRLVVGTPFELVMTFSLITGLALVLIGKMRG